MKNGSSSEENKMKRLIGMLILAFFVGLASADDSEIFAEIYRIKGIKVESTDYLTTANPEAAWTVYRALYGFYGHKPEGKDLVSRAGKAIANNHSVGPFVADLLKEAPNSWKTDSFRLRTFKMLGSIPSSWSAKLIGNYLLNSEPYENGGPIDASSLPNESYCTSAFAMMGFSDGPTSGWYGSLSQEQKDAWKQWWRENEPRIDERIKEINPSYDVPAPSDQPLETVAETSVAEGSPRVQKSPEKVVAAASPESMPENGSNLWIWFGVSLVFLIGLAALLTTIRGRRR